MSVKLYTQPFVWDSDYELDITSEIVNKLQLGTSLNSFHTLELDVKNNRYLFNTTTSDNFLFKGMRMMFTFNGDDYKFIIRGINPNVQADVISLTLSSHSYDLSCPPYAQIRVQNQLDGKHYLEDVLYSALYNTGQQNFFLIKLQDGSYYTPASSSANKTEIDSLDDIVYTRVSVMDILNDLCGKAGCIWYESDLADDEKYSVINIVNIESEYDIPADKILNISTFDNSIKLNNKSNFDTISNTIYFDNLPFYVQENESIDRYGSRSGTVISIPDDGDLDKYMKLMFSQRSILKDPEVSIPITCRRILDVPSLDMFVKVIGMDMEYDTASGIDRKYRLNSVKYDFVKNNTNLVIGNKYRKVLMEQMESVIKGQDDSKDSNETQMIGYQDELRAQVYTNEGNYDSSLTETSTGFGLRLGIDHLYDATYSPNSKFYMEDDDVRTGN